MVGQTILTTRAYERCGAGVSCRQMMFRDEERCLGQVVSVHRRKVEVGDFRRACAGQRETAQLDEISGPIIREQLFEV